ncbi:MAG: DUF1284 domain-containing protein [Proteobacteria bacterium]|nr:DUF1284 domain-containing protein [Pseudomonadota bacterium]
MKISFRPHHFLCTLGFQGKGYSPGFVQNYWQIVIALHQNEELPIQVVQHVDSVCGLCPYNGNGVCATEEKIQTLDLRHSQILGISPGDHLTWKEAKERIKKQMTLQAFHKACQGCQWKSCGVCETALRELREEGP